MTLSQVYIVDASVKQSVNLISREVPKEAVDSVIEIDYWVGNRKLSVEDKDKIKEFCTSLSALKLEEVTFSEKGTEKEGHLCVDLITKDEMISLGLLTHEIAIDSKTYSTDQDITKVLRNILMNTSFFLYFVEFR